MKDFIVVTGASGNVGRQVAKALLATGRAIRVVARTAEKLEPLGDRGAEMSPGSLDDRNFLTGALRGARAGRPLSRSGIAEIIQRYASKAATSLPSLEGRRITPHTLRHTTALHLLQSGVEVNVIRSWLGHVSISTTNRYIEIDLAMKAKALQTCEVTSPNAGEATSSCSPDILAWLESL